MYKDVLSKYIIELATIFLVAKDPVISVNCKKRSAWELEKCRTQLASIKKPTGVKEYDFGDKRRLGKAISYCVCDIANKKGWVSVGIDHDMASFVSTIKCWWNKMVKQNFLSNKLYITSDGGRKQQFKKPAMEKGIAVSEI